MMRVGLLSLEHLTNTFVAKPTTLDDFLRQTGLEPMHSGGADGTAIRSVHGMWSGLSSEGIEPVPVAFAEARPGGLISADAYAELVDWIQTRLASCRPLDALLVACGGSPSCETALDAFGHVLELLRAALGSLPIVATVAPNTNVSPAMVRASTALVPFRPSRHTSETEQGHDAALLLGRTLRGEVKISQSMSSPGVALDWTQHKAAVAELMERLEVELNQPRVLAGGICLGFPYQDAAHMGASAVVVCDDAPLLARRTANSLADIARAASGKLRPHVVELDEAVKLARTASDRIELIDLGDRCTFGGPGDGTLLLRALVDNGAANALVWLVDPDAVGTCSKAGQGSQVSLSLGGKSDWRLGEPVQCVATVQAVVKEGKRDCALIQINGGPLVLITTVTESPTVDSFSQLGIDPRQYKAVVTKYDWWKQYASNTSRTIVPVNTPGPTTIELGELVYHRRARPLYPFEED